MDETGKKCLVFKILFLINNKIK